jgi:nicotinamide riboside transporter PnuC
VLRAIFFGVFMVATIVPMTGIAIALAMFGRWLDWHRHPATKPARGQQLSAAWRQVRRFVALCIWTYLGAALVLAVVLAATDDLLTLDGLAFLFTYISLILLAARIFEVWPFARS